VGVKKKSGHNFLGLKYARKRGNWGGAAGYKEAKTGRQQLLGECGAPVGGQVGRPRKGG